MSPHRIQYCSWKLKFEFFDNIVPLWNTVVIAPSEINFPTSTFFSDSCRIFATATKWYTNTMHICAHRVPIVPNWNWNNSSYCEPPSTETFQSYLTGIEMTLSAPSSFYTQWFQSYLTGIEIRQGSAQKYPLRLVPIVPNWNWNRRIGGYVLNTSMVPIVPNWNWNFEEYIANALTDEVPIVPNWNWNSPWCVSWESPSQFQSYLTGIEIPNLIFRMLWV